MNRILFLGLAAIATVSVKVTDCSSGTSIFKISSLSFTPDIPIGGQNGTLHSVYDVPTEYNSGTVHYTCSLNGLPIYDKTFDICTQTSCPIIAGIHDDYSTSAIPAVTGKVICNIQWSDTSSNVLLCIQTNMSLLSKIKKALRGQRIRLENVDSDTCPLIEDYDPTYLEQEIIEDNGTSERDKKTQISLIALRSGMAYLNM